MTNETLLTILGFFAANLIAAVGAYVLLIQRITKLETIVSLLSEKAAEILHSPHTPELDNLLERRENLSQLEVSRLCFMLDECERDIREPKGTRLAAALTRISVCRRYNLPIPLIDDSLTMHKEV